LRRARSWWQDRNCHGWYSIYNKDDSRWKLVRYYKKRGEGRARCARGFSRVQCAELTVRGAFTE
jgi:hypothetical protein